MAAGKFVGIPVLRFRRQTYLGQRSRNRAAFVISVARKAMQSQTLDNLAHGQAWRQRRERVLEHHLHLLAQRTHLFEIVFVYGSPLNAIAPLLSSRNKPIARRLPAGLPTTQAL